MPAMKDAKRIRGLTPALSVRAAAARVLEARLAAVERWLLPALKNAADDPEHVHQLRVAARRARAAVDLFAAGLPKEVERRLRKQLRRIRRVVGGVRDADVFLLEVVALIDNAQPAAQPGLHWLAGRGLEVRLAAQEDLVRLADAQPRAFKAAAAAAMQELERSAASDSDNVPTLADLGCEKLAGLIDELTSAAQPPFDRGRLHEIRVAGKRLRYALEIFTQIFDPDVIRRQLARVESMQEMLGAINDSHVALTRLDEMAASAQQFQRKDWHRWRAGVQALQRFHRRRLSRETRRFGRFWENWQRDDLLGELQRLCQTGSGARRRRP
jgi:CHAD domain-containing protein